MNITDIQVKQRSSDWIAYLTSQPKIWECGDTQIEAIGKLVISLTRTLCICPPTEEHHTPLCIYYAPSPQEIYREFVNETR